MLHILPLDMAHIPYSALFQPRIQTCNAEGERPSEYECGSENRCLENALCILDNDMNENCICTSGYENVDNNCRDIDECENGSHECGDLECFNLEGTYRCVRVVDVVWAIDGTGSYKSYTSAARENFQKQIDYFKTKTNEGK